MGGANQSKLVYYDGSEYLGEVNAAGKQHGKGRISYANGDKLEGIFANGQPIECNLKYANGDFYSGQMRGNRYHGRGHLKTVKSQQQGLFRQGRFIYGKINFKEGGSFQGSLEGGKRSGKGVLIGSDGTVYNGYFKNDNFDGTGILNFADGSSYEGSWKDGHQDGEGTMCKFDAHKKLQFKYKGGFARGKFDGKGDITYSNGDRYIGAFRMGAKNGHGVYSYKNGDIYEGGFVNDVKCDENCKYSFKSGSNYVGGIKDGLYHGKGQLILANGEFYEGHFENGKKSGPGRLKTIGAQYDGEFLNNMKHGNGTIYYDDGDIFTGTFTQDKKNGKGITKNQQRRQQLIAVYVDGIKSGPYSKHISGKNEYDQEGNYLNGELHGQVRVRKNGESIIYTFQNGNKTDERQA